jgi:hypothetical protein
MTTSFADRIRQRYPEGLTGIFATGGTRTTYILERQRHQENPGVITDFADYADYDLGRLFELIEMFFDLGVQNLIIPLFSYQGFYVRGPEYAEKAARLCLRMIEDGPVDFYRRLDIDPYFVGIDTLIHLPEEHFAHPIGRAFERFQQQWAYREGHRKLILEMAPLPLYSFLRAPQVMGEQAQQAFEEGLRQSTDLKDMHDRLYRYYARAVYGTDIPTPHFYLGSNRNGDLKIRSMLPIALLCAGPFRLFYTPYPSLFITREVLQAILEDLAFGTSLSSTKMDYGGQVTADLLEDEYQRILQLRDDTRSIAGLYRENPLEGSD